MEQAQETTQGCSGSGSCASGMAGDVCGNSGREGKAMATIVSLSKEEAVIKAKELRSKLDALLQEMKALKTHLIDRGKSIIVDMPFQAFIDSPEVIAQHILSMRAVEDAIMRQGMVLKCIGTPNPYPNSKLTIDQIAGKMYETYCAAVGGKAFNGDPLPAWAEFSVDPAKETQANGWRAAAAASQAATVVDPTAQGMKM